LLERNRSSVRRDHGYGERPYSEDPRLVLVHLSREDQPLREEGDPGIVYVREPKQPVEARIGAVEAQRVAGELRLPFSPYLAAVGNGVRVVHRLGKHRSKPRPSADAYREPP